MLKKIWYHLEEFILLPILVFLVCLIFVQVILRFVFSSSLTWAEELARYLFVWLMWFGVSYAARNRTHLRVTMVRDKFPVKISETIELIVTIVWLLFGIWVAYKGIQMVQSIMQYKQVSAALQLPMQYAYAGVPLGAGLMCLRLIENMYHDYVVPLIKHEKISPPTDKEAQF